ncbi:YbjN domain-containing protein, partial [Phormidium sp. CCY1219]|uniref:YbjN domain-containing protein n=1 Tax=Phormidium sp. CCY1219 TaxID=2886104 RepID=UPI002D1F07EC
MAVQLDRICEFLDQEDWSYEVEPEQQRLIVTVEGMAVVIQIREAGEFVSFLVPQLLTISENHPQAEAAWETLLHLGWEYKLARWQRDPEDGEVRLQADLPLENSTLTARQFWRTLRGTVQIAQQGRERVQHRLETGEDMDRAAQKPGINLAIDPEGNEQVAFLGMLFAKIVEHQGNPQQIYPILKDNLHHLNAALIPALEHYWHRLQSRESEAQNPLIPAVFVEFGNLIQQFPLGNQALNRKIAIACYQAALTVWTGESAPTQWATTQNNLG